MATTEPVTIPLADKTSWAKRNPTTAVQSSQGPSRKLSEAEKAQRKVAAAERLARNKLLRDDINAYMEERAEKYAELANHHNVKVQKIEELVNAGTHYKKQRAPSLYNAYVHYLSATVNEGELSPSHCIIIYL